jgi:prepilin-type N-terminal cleavage/methylation domain-containing protein
MPTLLSRLAVRRRAGFTLVEIMIVVVIIGLLAAMGIPALQRVQRASRMTRYMSDLRVFSQAFEQYALENGGWPPNVGAGVVPASMTTALQISVWTTANTIVGRWNYDKNIGGVTAAISTTTTLTDAEMMLIDAKIDDGDLTTGHYREITSGRFAWILED